MKRQIIILVLFVFISCTDSDRTDILFEDLSTIIKRKPHLGDTFLIFPITGCKPCLDTYMIRNSKTHPVVFTLLSIDKKFNQSYVNLFEQKTYYDSLNLLSKIYIDKVKEPLFVIIEQGSDVKIYEPLEKYR